MMNKIIFIILSSLFAALPANSADKAKPNIIVILADDLGYADVGYHGEKDIGVVTPNIDRLAKNGSYFSTGYAMAPVCGPSRAALLTGRYQNRFGFEDNPGGPFRQNAKVKPGIPKSEVNLGEQLQALGYVTAWIGKDHQGREEEFHPNNRGFNRFFGFINGATSYYASKSKEQGLQKDKKLITESEYLTDAFGREAVSFIKDNAKSPFFLYLPFNAVHGPLEAKPEDLQKFFHIKEKKRRTMLAMNYAMDRSIGLVYDTLDELQLLENTLIVFYSDNGGKPINRKGGGNASLNIPLKGAKGTLLEGGIRVPFLMHWPKKIAQDNRLDFPVAAIDIFPTVLAATGENVQPVNKLDGVNLLPYLTEEHKKPAARNLYWRFLYQWAIRDQDWKLVKLKGAKKPELYNLSNDMSEQHNVAEKFPLIAQSLARQYNAWSSSMMKPQWSWQARFGGEYKVKTTNKKANKKTAK
ncbi:MAG: sulfatase-like hydrolase/transferase [Colwellia sp.]|nr:sulfatase-like hydrolase/transferase [Colwellia sp.]MCW8863668.1 sulfatase-like hydrolase/transferase [Colwellia sp.]MCW9082272.1 sulfatase-like hydrolase/transferase [Colwellia sp.]